MANNIKMYCLVDNQNSNPPIVSNDTQYSVISREQTQNHEGICIVDFTYATNHDIAKNKLRSDHPKKNII